MDLHFPDKGRSVERLHARELAREARAARIKRDRENNDARIREGMRDSGIGGTLKSVHCGICGSPYGRRGKPRAACEQCEAEAGRRELVDIGREKESDADRYGEYEDA